jgi:UDP-GlcNAc:undecaprenyl-phosphate/decaprenyl-phosphate GlcNAc-1-phosphate transferase
MPTLTTAAWLIALSAGLGFVLTRLARGVASRIGMVDGPDGRRKTQLNAVPVAGGVAVLIAALLALAVMSLLDPGIAAALTADSQKSVALLGAAILIAGVGLADDRFNLRARYKLLGQTAAVLVLVIGGDFTIHRISILELAVELGPFDVFVTSLWLLACVNALNLIDGMDGLLGTVGGIALVSLAIIAVLAGHTFAAVVALALAGAVFGFLWWNLPPATVYMGDAGSMLIGLVIGAVAIPTSLKGPATIALGAPLAILVLPMFDTTAAVIRRKLTGRGIATADRGHLHHVLMKNGLTAQRVLLVVAVLGLVAAGGALAGTALHSDLIALVAAAGVVVALIAGKLFGNAELRLIQKRITAFFGGLRAGNRVRPWELSVRLQGTADWDNVWEDLVGVAKALNLQTICLDVNAPAMDENFLGQWRNSVAAHQECVWRMEIPLYGNGKWIGRLSLVGERDDQPLLDTLMTVTKIIETAEVRATEMTTPRETRQAPTAEVPLQLSERRFIEASVEPSGRPA